MGFFGISKMNLQFSYIFKYEIILLKVWLLSAQYLALACVISKAKSQSLSETLNLKADVDFFSAFCDHKVS